MRNLILFMIFLSISACAIALFRLDITMQEHRPIKMYNQEFTVPMHEGSWVELHEEVCNE